MKLNIEQRVFIARKKLSENVKPQFLHFLPLGQPKGKSLQE
jgi:hypothetical protein